MLDDPRRIAQVDSKGMIGILSSLPEQLEEGLGLCSNLRIEPPRHGRIVVAGMGGSAIAGDITAAVAHQTTEQEVLVVRGYGLPPFVGPEDLLIFISYSGDTQETLSMYGEGLRRDCRCLTVSSGGELREIASSRGDPHVRVPRGLPPRGALGYLLAAPLTVLSTTSPSLREGMTKAIDHLSRVREGWTPAAPTAENRAKQLALALQDKTPIVYAPSSLQCVARRWQTQLNENAKVVAWNSALPEASHNEIVGWVEDPQASRFMPIVLIGPKDGSEEVHIDEVVRLLRENVEVQTVRSSERGILSHLLEFILLGDFVSVYLAVLRGVDPLPVTPIDRLKRAIRSRSGEP
ncbi:MAG: bifunctional phosphoglucose/phosphomannose isomerase [Thermoplasmata archaeon]